MPASDIIVFKRTGNSESSPYRRIGVAGQATDASPHRHDRITDELVDHSPFALDTRTEKRKVMVQEVGDFVAGHVPCQLGELNYIGEHHRDELLSGGPTPLHLPP